MSHTPGPYVVVHIGDRFRPNMPVRREGFTIVAPNGNVCIATTPTTYTVNGRDGEGPPIAELRGNAHLLAAAPEMLATLKGIEALIARSLPETAAGLRKVIAKAEA